MQPAEYTIIPSPYFFPLFFMEKSCKHVEPPTHNQISIIGDFALKVRSTLVYLEVSCQRRQTLLQCRQMWLSRRTLEAEIVPRVQMCALGKKGLGCIHRFRVEGERMADEHHVASE